MIRKWSPLPIALSPSFSSSLLVKCPPSLPLSLCVCVRFKIRGGRGEGEEGERKYFSSFPFLCPLFLCYTTATSLSLPPSFHRERDFSNTGQVGFFLLQKSGYRCELQLVNDKKKPLPNWELESLVFICMYPENTGRFGKSKSAAFFGFDISRISPAVLLVSVGNHRRVLPPREALNNCSNMGKGGVCGGSVCTKNPPSRWWRRRLRREGEGAKTCVIL